MAGEKILLVEDDPMIQDALGYSLEKEGFEVLRAFDGEEGLKLARTCFPHLVLLDLMLPKMGGLEVCREIRRQSTVPILIVTARGEETERVIGLELGADDYIVKPFGTRELLARVRANLRRVGFSEKAEHQIGPISMNLSRREVSKNGELVHLSFREFELLEALLNAHGAVVERAKLLDAVWGTQWVGDPRTLDVHMRWLREKLEEEPSDPKLFLTVRNVGYRLVTPEEVH
jgi:two-component system, OmpR family, response regulator VicR